jgi:hypothetical protein
MSIPITIPAIVSLNKLLNYFQKERHNNHDKKIEAVMAIYVAANETKIYLQQIQKRRSRKVERKLSGLWSRAGILCNRLNADLVDRCLMKSDYWIAPQIWKKEYIRLLRFGLDQILEDTQKFLR